ncbi:hypothetical protein QCA50_013655 [Cerrena zonata]|uniref:MYND-type domain-containing protein n=1 Tax=Cerrena zonata TaxID=2478898 RepID=A0AAW0FNX5_9APHY
MFRPVLFPQVTNHRIQLETTLGHLKRTPSKVARELKKLHEECSPERFRAMSLIHDSIDGEFDLDDDFFHRLAESELPMILFAIACDSSNYDYPTYTDHHITYFEALFGCLRLCITRLRWFSSYSCKLHLASIMVGVEVMWKAIEQHRAKIIETPVNLNLKNNVSVALCDLLNVVRNYLSHGTGVGLDETGMALYAHAFCRVPSLSSADDGSLSTMLTVVAETNSRELVRRILIDEGQAQYLLSNLSEELRDNNSNMRLHYIVAILFMVTLLVAPEEMPQILKSSQPDFVTPIPPLIITLSVAVQWPLCRAEENTEPGTDILTLRHSLEIINLVVFEFGLTLGKEQHGVGIIRKMDLLPLYSTAIVSAETPEDVQTLERSAPILAKFIDLYNTPSTPHEIKEEIRNTMLCVFSTAFEAIEARTFLRNNNIGHLWMMLGECTKVCEIYSTRTVQLEKRDHLPGYNAYFKSCAWRGCLCSHKRPSHHMQVCKGCWVVHYCNKKCQESDWTHGEHSKVCRKPNA